MRDLIFIYKGDMYYFLICIRIVSKIKTKRRSAQCMQIVFLLCLSYELSANENDSIICATCSWPPLS